MTKEEAMMWMAVGVADHYAKTDDCRVYFGRAKGVIDTIKKLNPDISTLAVTNALLETISNRKQNNIKEDK
ncbi:TPA: hypothetical protein ACJ2XI_002368 [Klebsiella quasipneumoniae]